MHGAADRPEGNHQGLDGIGEILSRGVELWLIAKEREAEVMDAKVTPPLEGEDEQPQDALIEFVRQHGQITTRDAIQLTSVSRSTTRRVLDTLVASGTLSLHGKGRGAHYKFPPHN